MDFFLLLNFLSPEWKDDHRDFALAFLIIELFKVIQLIISAQHWETHWNLTLLILAGTGCVRRVGVLVAAVGGAWAGCWVPGAPVMGMFCTEMPCGVMWWIWPGVVTLTKSLVCTSIL